MSLTPEEQIRQAIAESNELMDESPSPPPPRAQPGAPQPATSAAPNPHLPGAPTYHTHAPVLDMGAMVEYFILGGLRRLASLDNIKIDGRILDDWRRGRL